MTITIPVVLLGCGGVGLQLLQHISNKNWDVSGVRLVPVAICDSQQVALASAGFSDSALQELVAAKASKKSLASSGSEGVVIVRALPAEADELYKCLLDVSEEALQALAAAGAVVVDCTASDSLGPVLARLAEAGHCVVLANKKPVTGSLAVYEKFVAAGRRFRCEATCGAGLPVLVTLSRMLAAGDDIYSIAGALSGTLGYVMSGLEEGRPFSEVVRAAKAAGFTEPDPRDDLGGMDVARKALILARQLGWQLNMEDVQVESLYPESMASSSVEDFLSDGLLQLDAPMKARAEEAVAKGCVLRYAATVADGKCSVGLAAVPKDSPLGLLKGSDNLVQISSRCYSTTPLVIQGAGAGNDTTAAGVLADIVDMQDLFNTVSARSSKL